MDCNTVGKVSLMALPSLDVQEIPAEGLSFDRRVQAEELGLGPSDVRVSGDFLLHAQVFRMDQELNVTGRLSGKIVRECVRCLKEYEDACEFDFSAQYRIKSAPPAARGKPKQLSGHRPPEDIAPSMEGEIYSVEGDQIELSPMLREQVILGSPMQPLCREGCQGLCPVCGQDRNLQRCECVEHPAPNPFHVLRGLRTRSGK